MTQAYSLAQCCCCLIFEDTFTEATWNPVWSNTSGWTISAGKATTTTTQLPGTSGGVHLATLGLDGPYDSVSSSGFVFELDLEVNGTAVIEDHGNVQYKFTGTVCERYHYIGGAWQKSGSVACGSTPHVRIMSRPFNFGIPGQPTGSQWRGQLSLWIDGSPIWAEEGHWTHWPAIYLAAGTSLSIDNVTVNLIDEVWDAGGFGAEHVLVRTCPCIKRSCACGAWPVGRWDTMTLTISGAAPGTGGNFGGVNYPPCDKCANYNGTFVLDRVPDRTAGKVCVWELELDPADFCEIPWIVGEPWKQTTHLRAEPFSNATGFSPAPGMINYYAFRVQFGWYDGGTFFSSGAQVILWNKYNYNTTQADEHPPVGNTLTCVSGANGNMMFGGAGNWGCGNIFFSATVS